MITQYKLGKLAPKFHPKTLSFAKYFKKALPFGDPPNKVWREYKIPDSSWGMYRNDVIGDCTCAAAAHVEILVSAHTGNMIIPDEGAVVADYSAITGYDPNKTDANGNNPTDTGAVMTDVLNYWATNGIGGSKILGWAAIDQKDLKAVRQAIWLFGGLDVGVQFPFSALTQLNNGQSWNVLPDDGGIDGGHAIPIFGYGRAGCTCITWGQRQQMNWAWFQKYCDEAYAVITQDWLDQATGKTPGGFDLATLQTDLAVIKA